MSLTRQELGSMTLQRLAYILPQTAEEETMVKEVFESRARNSTYQTLTTIDVKLGWQENILQKFIDEKREVMAPENPVSLTPEDEARLDTAVITKDTELELQAKLDAKNKKQKGLVSLETEEEISDDENEADMTEATSPKEDLEIEEADEEITELEGSGSIDEKGNAESEPVKVKRAYTKRK